MRKEDGQYERDFPNGTWIKTELEGEDAIGLIFGFDKNDGEYWCIAIAESEDPHGVGSPWESQWIPHEPVERTNPPKGFGGMRDHVFLVGTRSRVSNVEAFADVETLVEAYPDEREHALLSVTDPDVPMGDSNKTAVRFAIVKGGDGG